MENTPTYPYYVIKPTTYQKRKLALGSTVHLTESQARPLRNGGFITPDKHACERIETLVNENALLTKQLEALEAIHSNAKDPEDNKEKERDSKGGTS